MSPYHWYALKDALTFVFEMLFMILYAAVISLPGLGIAYVHSLVGICLVGGNPLRLRPSSGRG
jgi:hypothetical protein